MKTTAKQRIRRLVPAAMHRWWRHTFGWKWFEGDYATWAEARAASSGYDDAAVLVRVRTAIRAVRAGHAAWERDGVTFTEPAVYAPLLAALRVSVEGGCLNLVDFGGSLGSTWWQYRTALTGLSAVRWRVVEQPHFVDAGREFSDDVLAFYASLDEALAGTKPGTILLSSVLPYLEHPRDLLADVVRRRFRHVIIDRTPVLNGECDRLVVQRNPPSLGGGSYPCWLFARASLLTPFQRDYRLAAEWPGFDDIAPGVDFRGFLLERTSS